LFLYLILLNYQNDSKPKCAAVLCNSNTTGTPLNLNAYINRTQIANQLAIAQGVSTASWSKYAAQTSTNISRATSWFPPVSAVFSNIGTGLNYFADSLGIYIEVRY
jgi:hypothetical protein